MASEGERGGRPSEQPQAVISMGAQKKAAANAKANAAAAIKKSK
jgi:hypothetical protein